MGSNPTTRIMAVEGFPDWWALRGQDFREWCPLGFTREAQERKARPSALDSVG